MVFGIIGKCCRHKNFRSGTGDCAVYTEIISEPTIYLGMYPRTKGKRGKGDRRGYYVPYIILEGGSCI